MLVNWLLTFRLAIKFLDLNVLTSLPNENESWTESITLKLMVLMLDHLWVQTCQCFVVSLLQCPVELLLSVNKRYVDGIFATFDS